MDIEYYNKLHCQVLKIFQKNKKNIENEHYYGYGSKSATFAVDLQTGQTFGNAAPMMFSTQLYENPTVRNIVNKQLNTLEEASIQLLEIGQKGSAKSENKHALALYEQLLNPNCRPAPSSWRDILKGILHQYNYFGITALVFSFDGVYNPANLQYIQIGSNVGYITVGNECCYNISIQTRYSSVTKQYRFVYDVENGVYMSNAGSEKLVAVIFGNYDFYYHNYISPWHGLEKLIISQNAMIEFNKSFQENACRPSALVSLIDKTKTAGESFTSEAEIENFKKLVDDFKERFQGKNNGGEPIIPNDPRLEIQYTPITTPLGADDYIKQFNLISEKIYSYFPGGTKSAFEGGQEYSGNAITKLKDLYDGMLSYGSSVITDPLNNFLQKMLREFDSSNPNRKNIYLSFDRSQIEFYKRFEEQRMISYVQNHILDVPEGREQLAKLRPEDYSNLKDITKEDLFISAFGKKSPLDTPHEQKPDES